MRIREIGAVAHQAAGHSELAKSEDGGNCMPCGQRSEPFTAGEEKRIGTDDEPARRQLADGRKNRIEVAVGTGL